MRKLAILTLLVLLHYSSQAQVINNKINLYIGYSIGAFHGGEMTKEGSFISPSFFANLNHPQGVSLKGVVRQEFYSLGLGFDFASASGWEAGEHDIFTNASLRQYAVSPTVQFHRKFVATGKANRLRKIIEIAPTIGLATVSLDNPVFVIHTERESFAQAMASTDLFFGIKGSAGLEYAVNETFGIYGTYTLQHGRVSATLYADRYFTNSMLTVGFFKRLKKDKRFFY